MGKDKEKGEAYLEILFLSSRVALTMVTKVFPRADNRCLGWLLDGSEWPQNLQSARRSGKLGLPCAEGRS